MIVILLRKHIWFREKVLNYTKTQYIFTDLNLHEQMKF